MPTSYFQSTLKLNRLLRLLPYSRTERTDAPQKNQIVKHSKILYQKKSKTKNCLSLFLGSDLFFRCCLSRAKQNWLPAVEEAMRAFSKAEIRIKCQVLVSISLHLIDNYKLQNYPFPES